MDWIQDGWIDWQKTVDNIDGDKVLEGEVNLLKGNEMSQEVLPWFLRCMGSAAKAEYNKTDLLTECRESFSRLYRDSIPKVIGFLLCEHTWEWMIRNSLKSTDNLVTRTQRTVHSDEAVLLCLGLLTDLSVVTLHSLQDDSVDDGRVNDTVAIVRALCRGLDKNTLFHLHHAHQDLPSYIQYTPHTFTASFLRPVIPDLLNVPICTGGLPMSSDLRLKHHTDGSPPPAKRPCKCPTCEPPESYRWITILLEYFGSNIVCDYNGFQELLRVLETIRELRLEVVEVVLHLVSVIVEYLKEEVACAFLGACIQCLSFLCNGENHELIKQHSGTVCLMLKHLDAIFRRFLLPEVASRMISEGRQRMEVILLTSLGIPAADVYSRPPARQELTTTHVKRDV